MDTLELIIGNRTYSSWSMRPWLALRHIGVPFVETYVSLYVPGFKQKLLDYGGAGKVPMLRHGGSLIWDSLAICEYLAENFPAARLWPVDSQARALARALSAEMHSGFQGIRNVMPFNCRTRGRHVKWAMDVDAEIARVQEIWLGCRERYSNVGPWLFGNFSIADAMYIPVALRFVTYGVELKRAAREYVATAQALPAVQEWIAKASQEAEVLEASEVGK